MRFYDYSFLIFGRIPVPTMNLLIAARPEPAYHDLVEREAGFFTCYLKENERRILYATNNLIKAAVLPSRIEVLLSASTPPLHHNEVTLMRHKQLHEQLLTQQTLPPLTANLIAAWQLQLAPNYPLMPEARVNIDQIFHAYYSIVKDRDIQPLLLIPCLLLDFMLVQPTSNPLQLVLLLANYLLISHGYTPKMFALEAEIEQQFTNFQRHFHYSARGWEEGINDYFPFINLFLTWIYNAITPFNRKCAILRVSGGSKWKRIEATFRAHPYPLTRTELGQIWPDLQADTLKKALLRLQQTGVIKKIGSYRNAKYQLNAKSEPGI